MLLCERATIAAHHESYMRFWSGLCRRDLVAKHRKAAVDALYSLGVICDDNHLELRAAVHEHMIRLSTCGGMV